MDVMTKSQRHLNMQHIRGKDSKPEIILRQALWKKGIRYRKNYKRLPGCPDIVLTRYKIAIFVDGFNLDYYDKTLNIAVEFNGDFWHARGYQDNPGSQINSNKAFWQKKLTRNVERDKEVNDRLTQMGWLVLRFWESDICKNLPYVLEEIDKYV